MNPNNGSQGGGSPNPSTPQDERTAAANVLRSQIDELYGNRSVAPVPRSVEPQPQQTENPYERTHSSHPQPQAEQWKAYHTAWQSYYQQYYEAYYAYQATQQQALKGSALSNNFPVQQSNPTPTEPSTPSETKGYFSAHTDLEETTEDLSKDQALYELRQKLLGKVKHQATKIRRSRHFVPIAAALTVVLIFAFLQYNRVLLATVNAYISPGTINPQNIVIDPTKGTSVSPDPRLIIPKINVDVPVTYDISPAYDAQMAAMQNGVAHFSIPGARSHPGEIGNTVISGHSSNDLFEPGDYKFIFAQLDRLENGDTIYANYKGQRYTYVVTKKEVVLPTQVDKLIYPTTKPMMTLITCTPVGTAEKRLLVTAEQVSPDPAEATEVSDESSGNEDKAEMPGYSSTLLERLFGQ